jgi:hypothetical protein
VQDQHCGVERVAERIPKDRGLRYVALAVAEKES